MQTSGRTDFKSSLSLMFLIGLLLAIIFFAKDTVIAEENDSSYDDECYTMGGSFDEVEEASDMGIASCSDTDSIQMYSASGFTTVGFNGIQYTHEDKFKGTTVRRGIDVSKWQKNIDWQQVKNSGVEYAFIRVAFRSAKEGKLGQDEYGIQNLRNAKKAGLKVGVYIFSEAITVQEAEEEADYVLGLIDGFYLDLPVVFDYEDGYYIENGNRLEGRFIKANVSKELGTQMCNAFCNRIKSKGYTAMVYANVSTLTGRLIPEQIYNTNYIWVARYNNTVSTNAWKYTGNYNFWQYSESLSIAGITGNSVDGDFWYDDGLSMALNRTGLFYQGNDLYFFRSGYLDYGYTGIQKCKNTWYYVKNGKVDCSFTGLAKNEYGWWYVKNGIVDFNYNGLCQNSNGIWLVQGSKVQFGYTGVMKFDNVVCANASDANNAVYNGWYSIVDGKLVTHEILLSNSYGWWYCNGGKVDFSANKLAKNENGWWRIKDGKVDFDFEGIYRFNNADWYLKGGKVRFDVTNLVNVSTNEQEGISFEGCYYIKDGKVVYNQNGLVKNENGWWYVEKDGKVHFDYNGFVSNQNGTWYVVNSKVDFGCTGVVKSGEKEYLVEQGKFNNGFSGIKKFDEYYYFVNGVVDRGAVTVEKYSDGWYYIKNGIADLSANTVAKNANGWWVIRNGKVDFSFNGVADNSNGTWYCVNGKVDFNAKGVLKTGIGWYNITGGKVIKGSTVAQNSFGWWYIGDDGKVDFSYNGLAKNSNGTWVIQNGKVNFSYNGKYTYNNKVYNIKNGKVV